MSEVNVETSPSLTPCYGVWIDVNHQLPEKGQYVILLADRYWNVPEGIKDMKVTATGYLSEHGSLYWSVFSDRGFDLDAFTHWIPPMRPFMLTPNAERGGLKMRITSEFGTAIDLERGTSRQWVIGRDGVGRCADSGHSLTQELLNSIMRDPGETRATAAPVLPKCPQCGERYCGDGVQQCTECANLMQHIADSQRNV